ncbi:hypothetical protein [Actinacidiphila oryziradicis]|uniref:hypothetical protein n=1 Tax=Actinacidiphila oryziradicis TaxID=2571141 RepID=UPI0023F40B42|nr:hypothetical protein [Actinacidiphila oryziradicis]MCW2874402.1 glycosyl hydrolase [Actinacidiphila oryziradicis]
MSRRSPGSLAGIFVSKSGSPLGPWSRIADCPTPGVQAWYDQFLPVDPTDAGLGPDGKLHAATHCRGIYSISVSDLK